MVVIYYLIDSCIRSENLSDDNQHLLQNARWVDLVSPTKEEEKIVEAQFQIEIPTKEEIAEIEPSSRLYVENNVAYLTATMIALSDLPEVKTDAVTFIVAKQSLITLRYTEFQAFKSFTAKQLRSKIKEPNVLSTLVGLLDAAIERLADILEKISHKHDEISHLIFHQKTDPNQKTDYKAVLQDIGSNGDLGAKASESLMTFTRLISFVEQTLELGAPKETLTPLTILHQDINALREHANFLSVKYNFLLDATLGMINIEQSNIIKIFSVAAVIFLPPTLIASIYGMNFDKMPELHWSVGYPFAIVLMMISAWLPFRYFKKKKWL